MWNGRYGMHQRGMGMMGGASGTNTLSSEEALKIAQRWLGTSRPGTTVEEHADPFYGYYTIHTTKDGQVEGMLSVHGTTGQVWYHTWHGDFVQMIEHGDDH
jgi:cell division protein FtsX